mmetsp:Transcript_21889/g.56112  ORF Transcript_21889/g.56112 Transcript_21889/m.56112 type:complete len:234 (-) Transcript_21889:639-1340(-)
MVPVHERRHVAARLLFGITLRKHLLLKPADPDLVLLPGQRAVSHVRQLEGDLQRQDGFILIHGFPLGGATDVARQPRVAGNHGVKAPHDVKVPAHLRAKNQLDNGLAEVVKEGAARHGAAQMLREVEFRELRHRQSGAQAVVLCHRLVVEGLGHGGLLLDEEVVGHLRVLIVVQRRRNERRQACGAGAEAREVEDGREASRYVRRMKPAVVPLNGVALLQLQGEADQLVHCLL